MSASATVLASRMMVRLRMRHLQVFLNLAELGSVQRAAQAVGLTQPSTSHVLADLEALLECQLFERHARGVTPTRAAMLLLPQARRIIDGLHACADTASALAQSAHGEVRVAAVSSAITGWLAFELPEFSRRHPDLLVQVQELEMPQIGMAITRGEVDLVLCRQPEVLPAHWVFEPVQPDHFVVVCGPQHPLARRKRVTREQLWQQTWLLGPSASAARRVFDQLCQSDGVVPARRLVNARSPAIIASMLAQDPLLSLIPLSFARQLLQTAQLHALPVSLALPFDPLGMMHRPKEEGAAARCLREFLLAHSGLGASRQDGAVKK